MKLTHHDDATWSLSGMTDAEVQLLAHALSNQVAQEARLSEGRGAWQGFDADDAAYFAKAWVRTDHLRRWLDTATRCDGGLRRRASTTYVARAEAE